MRKFWKKYHKWVGLFFSFFILMFCLSGIVLNHRKTFSACEVSRSWMPDGYQYENYDNGIAKGTMSLSNGKVLLYGNAGVWLTDSCLSSFTSYNQGLKEGMDNRKISNVVLMPDMSMWCAGLYDFYRHNGKEWELQILEDNDERIADITNRNDTLVLLTRSYVYESVAPYENFKRYELKKPADYSPKVSMFRTVWLLHSGELFGLPGQLFVDAIALVIVVLCITGLIYTFLPKWIKKRKKAKKDTKQAVETLKTSTKWHNKLGTWLIVPTVLLAITGACLRPPLMIPFAITSVNPVPGSTLDADNIWHNKFRGLRWDARLQQWLLSTSSGFYQLADFDAVPVSIKGAPPVSPMGINVFHQTTDNEWLVGSFSGLFQWNPVTKELIDFMTGEPYLPSRGRFFGSVSASGYSSDLSFNKDVIFDYSDGARTKQEVLKLADMPDALANQGMSLWNFALELHVGRCYAFLGPLSGLFVFLAGTLLTLTLISGYILRPGRKKKK